MRTILTSLSLLLFLTACQLSPEQRAAYVERVDQQYTAGLITKAERDATIEKINSGIGQWDIISLVLAALGVATGGMYVGNRRTQNQVDELYDRTHSPVVKA